MPKKPFDANEYVDGMFDDLPPEFLNAIPANSKVNQIDTIDPRQVVPDGVQDSTGVTMADYISPSHVLSGVADNIPMTAFRRTAPPIPRSYAKDTVDNMFADLPSDLGGPSRDNIALNPMKFQVGQPDSFNLDPLKFASYTTKPLDFSGLNQDDLADAPPMDPIKDRLFPPSAPQAAPSLAERLMPPSGPSRMEGSSVALKKKR